jgi:RecA/RadA recombinase
MTHRSALELLRTYERRGYILSTGDTVVDETIGGGIMAHGITEICGEAGAGKTQLCLTLALQCYLDREHGGLGSGSIYLCCGEGQFPDRRLEQLAASYALKCPQNTSDGSRDMSTQAFMENVFVENVHHTEQALEVLSKQIPELCRKHSNNGGSSIRLLILDSLAGLARTEFDSSNRDDMKIRTATLFNIASKLKWLSDTFGMCIVVVNQVTAGGFNTTTVVDSPLVANMGNNSHFIRNNENAAAAPVPALGLVWSTCVNTRILLRRHTMLHSTACATDGDSNTDATNNEAKHGDKNGNINANVTSRSNIPNEEFKTDNNVGLSSESHSNVKRSLHLELSPIQVYSSCSYEITSEGIRGVNRFS